MPGDARPRVVLRGFERAAQAGGSRSGLDVCKGSGRASDGPRRRVVGGGALADRLCRVQIPSRCRCELRRAGEDAESLMETISSEDFR